MCASLPTYVSQRLQEPFGKLQSTANFGEAVNDIAALINDGQLDKDTVDKLLQKHGINEITHIKLGILDMILAYVGLVLQDDYVSAVEAENVKFLNRFFKVKEGDFFQSRYYEVEQLFNRQFENMYRDNSIDRGEALQKVELQELFDLSYDQFLELSRKAVQAALARGCRSHALGHLSEINIPS